MTITFKEYIVNEDEIKTELDENRRAPPSMNYQFDEIDPDVNEKSYSKGRRERVGQNNDSPDYNREMGFQKHAQQQARGVPDDDSGMEHQMMHGTEEEEAKAPAIRDRDMMAKGDRDRTPIRRGSVTSNKRNAQRAGRKQRSRMGKGSGGSNYMDTVFGKGGRPEDYD